jgi:6,7-dimethyl-8-ribityllumazine synthase
MARTHEGELDGRGLRAGIVVSRFNSFVSERLLEGALDCLHRHGMEEDAIGVYRVPGAREIPPVAARLAAAEERPDMIVCLGAVIRGETPHFDYVCAESSKGVARLAMEADIPLAYGIITADTVEQAVDRAGAKSGNRGFDAAMTALEMARLYRRIDGDRKGT